MTRQITCKSFALGALITLGINTLGRSQPPIEPGPAAGDEIVGVLQSAVDHPQALTHPSAGVSRQDPDHRVASAGDFIGFSHTDGSGSHKITLFDTSKRWLAVYHVDRDGNIRIRSSRDASEDFSFELNATEPTSQRIRQMQR